MTLSVLETRPQTETQPSAVLDTETRQDLRELVLSALADSYVLMIKTQAVHWNITGPMFKSVHDLTEEQYDDLFEAIDDLAERIRALGLKAPMNYISMQDISVLEPFTGNTPSASELVETLARDNDTISRRLMAGIKAASEEGDPATEDIFTERLRAHQKAAWMLRAMVEQK